MTTRFGQSPPSGFGGKEGLPMSLKIDASRVLKNCSSSSTTAVPGGGPPASGARTGSPLARRACGAPTKRKYAATPPTMTPSMSARTNFMLLSGARLLRGRGRGRRRQGGGRALLLLRVDEAHHALQERRHLRGILLHLFGRDLRVALRQLELRRVNVRFQVLHLGDE